MSNDYIKNKTSEELQRLSEVTISEALPSMQVYNTAAARLLEINVELARRAIVNKYYGDCRQMKLLGAIDARVSPGAIKKEIESMPPAENEPLIIFNPESYTYYILEEVK